MLRSRTRTIAAACLVTIALIWLLSGWFSLYLRSGDRMEFSIAGGEVRLIFATENRRPWNPIWHEIYYYGPEYQTPMPASGLHANSAFALDWSMPALRRTDWSATGAWWTLQVPFWFVFGTAILIALRRSRFLVACRQSALRLVSKRYFVQACKVASIVVLGLWFGSAWFGGYIRYRLSFIDLDAGVLQIHSWPEHFAPIYQDQPFSWYCGSNQPPTMKWCIPHSADIFMSSWGRWWEINIPLWFVLVLVATPAVVAAVHRRRIPPGHCQKCGYNLTGNVSGCCSECGLRFRSPPKATPPCAKMAKGDG